MYDQLPRTLFPASIYIMHDEPYYDEDKKEKILRRFYFSSYCKTRISYGMKGILFRKIDNEEQLIKYHGTLSR